MSKIAILGAGRLGVDLGMRLSALVAEMGFESVDVGPIRSARALDAMAQLYLVPCLLSQRDEAFEYYFRTDASPTQSSGVRAAG